MSSLKPEAAARTTAGAAPRAPAPVSDEPFVVVDAQAPPGAFNLGELWAYRELLYFLTWRDVKVRYKQTALGVVWVVLQPLLTTLIFTVFLGMLARVPSDGAPYALFVYAGLLPWTFFSTAVLNSGHSLVGSSHLITKVYFPRLLIPASATAARLVDFAIGFVALGALLAFYRVAPSWNLLWLPALVALVALLALGVGVWASALNVKYRDVGVALPVLVQLWMFFSPIVYPAGLVPARWQWLYALNPLVGVTEGFRAVLFNRPLPRPALAASVLITLVVLASSVYAFRRMEKSFADVV